MRRITLLVYAMFGAIAIIYGIAAIVLPTALSSEAASSSHLAHVMREQGAAILFIGLMALWCMFNYSQSKIVHYFLMVFTFALALIHWFEFFAGNRTLASPLVNSIPFVVLLAIALIRPKQMEVIA